MKKIYLVLTLIIITTISIRAQNSIKPNMYFQDMNYYNTASIPMDFSENFYLSLLGKYKFVENENEIWNKPVSIYLNHIGKLGQSNSYYSIAYLNDDYSFFNRNELNIGYIHQLKWGKSSSLSFSGRAILNFDAVNWDKIEFPVSRTGKTLAVNPDLDLGIEYKVKDFTLGLAGQNLIGYKMKQEGTGLIENKRTASLNTSYLFTIAQNFKIAPFTFFYWDRKMWYDVGLYFSIYEYVRLSYAFRINELRSICSIDCRIIKNLYLGAAFDFTALEPDKNLDVVLKYSF